MNVPRRSVLVVDDNVDSAEMTADLLRLYGFDVAVAHTAREALALVPKFAPEVALLDIGLPDMNGYELAHRIAASSHRLPAHRADRLRSRK